MNAVEYIFIICYFAVAARCKNKSASEEDTGAIEDIEFPDFPPFMGQYRKYKNDLSEMAKIALMTNGMESLRNHELMRGLIKRMFDYDLEVEEIERKIYSNPARMKLTFNYIDLSFQLFPLSSDETFKLIARHLNDLCKYYNRKACLNLNHSE